MTPPEPLQKALAPDFSTKASPGTLDAAPFPCAQCLTRPREPPCTQGTSTTAGTLHQQRPGTAVGKHRRWEPGTGRGGNRPSNPAPGSPFPTLAPCAAVCFSSAVRPANRCNVPRALNKIGPRKSPRTRPRARVMSALRRGCGGGGCPMSLPGRRHWGVQSHPMRDGLGAAAPVGGQTHAWPRPAPPAGTSTAEGRERTFGIRQGPVGKDPAALRESCGVQE